MNVLQDRKTLVLICLFLIIFEIKSYANEKLVYSIISKGPDYTKTEIYTIDPETNHKKLVFSDEKTPIVLFHHFYVFDFPVIGGNRLFAHALERGAGVSTPGSNASLYEIFLDGTLRCRKITKVLGESSLSNMFVNSIGTRIGYISGLKGKAYIFIFDVRTGELLYQIDITDKFLDCYVSSIGYIPGTERIYLSVNTGDVHVTSKESYAKVGAYIMQDDGNNLIKLNIFSDNEEIRMISILPTGEYFLETRRNGKRPKLFRVKDANGHKEDMSFNSATLYSGVIDYHLSPSGKYLSAFQLPIYSAPVLDIWLKDLNTGKEIKLFSIPTEDLKGPFLGVDGWID